MLVTSNLCDFCIYSLRSLRKIFNSPRPHPQTTRLYYQHRHNFRNGSIIFEFDLYVSRTDRLFNCPYSIPTLINEKGKKWRPQSARQKII